MKTNEQNNLKLQDKKVRVQDNSERKSLRSLASSKYDNKYSVQQVLAGQGLSNGVKQQLNKAYQQYDSGKITQQQFSEFIKDDLKLQTNATFDKHMKRVSPTFVEILSGVEKQKEKLVENFKPNTTTNQLLQNSNYYGSLNGFQEQYSKGIKYDSQNQLQKYCVGIVDELITGQINEKEFIQKCQNSGISTDNLGPNLRQFRASNSVEKAQLCSKLYKSAVEKCLLEDDKLITLSVCGNSPTRAQRMPLQPINNLKSYNPEILASDMEQDQTLIDHELRKVMGGTVYNEIKGQGEFNESKMNNGDIFLWSDKPQESPRAQARETLTKQQKSSINLKLEETKNIPYVEKIRRKNINQMYSTGNIIAPMSYEPVTSPKKNISQLMGSGNIISWA